jgi:hypothetical protein
VNRSKSPARRVPAHGNSPRQVFAQLGTTQSLIVSLSFLAEKTNGRFKKLQPPLQPRWRFGRNSGLFDLTSDEIWFVKALLYILTDRGPVVRSVELIASG